MKKKVIFTVFVSIFIFISCMTASAADESGGTMMDDPFRGIAVEPATEAASAPSAIYPEDYEIIIITVESGEAAPPIHLKSTSRSTAPAPSTIYPGDYQIILKDSMGDRFYLNKKAESFGRHYLYRGYWSSKWSSAGIEPVTVVYNKTNGSMALTAMFQGIKTLTYTLLQSSYNRDMFSGSEAYVFKNNDHYTDSVYEMSVEVEKGEFPLFVGSGHINYLGP